MLGGHMVWVGMSRGRFVGGRNAKVPKYDLKSCNKTSIFHLTAGWRSLMCKKNHVTKSQHFTSGKGGHDVTEHLRRVDVMFSHVTNLPPRSRGLAKIPGWIVQV